MPSEWTVDTLKEHMAREIDHVKELNHQGLESAREAVDKAEANIERRLQALNELRSVVTDQQGTFVTRNAWELLNTATSEKLSALSSRLDKTEGRGTGLNAGWGYLVGAIGIVAIVIEVILRLK